MYPPNAAQTAYDYADSPAADPYSYDALQPAVADAPYNSYPSPSTSSDTDTGDAYAQSPGDAYSQPAGGTFTPPAADVYGPGPLYAPYENAPYGDYDPVGGDATTQELYPGYSYSPATEGRGGGEAYDGSFARQGEARFGLE